MSPLLFSHCPPHGCFLKILGVRGGLKEYTYHTRPPFRCTPPERAPVPLNPRGGGRYPTAYDRRSAPCLWASCGCLWSVYGCSSGCPLARRWASKCYTITLYIERAKLDSVRDATGEQGRGEQSLFFFGVVSYLYLFGLSLFFFVGLYPFFGCVCMRGAMPRAAFILKHEKNGLSKMIIYHV